MRRLVLLVLALCPLAHADDPPPVEMGALARGFARPAQGRPEILGGGAWQQRIYLNDTNEYASRGNASEALVADGEATVLSYGLRYGFGGRWEAELLLPVIAQGGGILDGLIEGWHSTWG